MAGIVAASAIQALPSQATPATIDGATASVKSHGVKNGLPEPEVFNAKPKTGFNTVGGPAGTAPITFHGGLAPVGGGTNVGVTTGAPRIYVVFWGSLWGTQGSTTVNGISRDTFSGDPQSMAPYLESLIDGLGKAGDNWSGVATEFCDQLATGATSCGKNDTANRVGYPTGGMLSGIWYDPSVTLSTSTSAYPTQTDLGNEALAAAAHFGNNTQSSNRSVQYVIVSPTGVHPAGFNTSSGTFCAWHSYATNSTAGNIAYTNLPYIPDMGGSCGANWINAGAAGTLDGVSIVEGHELSETITDQWPGSTGGYWDSKGYENGDKCSWTNPADSRNGGNITLTTGTFAMQGTWSNLNAWCNMGSTLTGTTALSTAANGTLTARLVNGGAFPYSLTAVTALPGTLTIGNDGRIYGNAPATGGTYSYAYNVVDAAGNTTTANGTLTVTGGGVVSPTTTALSASATSVTTSTTVKLTATVSPVVSGGSVAFYDGSTLLGSATTSTSGVATLSKTFAAGSHSVTAVFAGTSAYATSTSAAVVITSLQATTLSLKASTTNTTRGTAVTFTATLSVRVAGLTVVFQDGTTGATLGTATTSSTGVATFTTSWPNSGTYSVKSAFSGTSTYAASTSSSVSVRVK